MFSNHSLVRYILLSIVIVAMLGVPIVAGAQATNGFTSPKDNATVSGTVNVAGNVGGPNFSKWQLDLLPGGNPNTPIFLAVGTAPGAVTYALDTTKWPDGAHALRLRNVRADSNYDEYVVKFTIANKAAPAAATTTAKGMSAAPATPAPAAPITATRTTTATTTAAVRPAPVAAAAAATGPGITSPKAGSNVQGVVTVTGSVGGPNFSKWQLDLLPGGNPNAPIFLAFGTTPGAVSYAWNTAAWPDGPHALRLRNVRADSNYDEYTTPVTITNSSAAKPGAAAAAAAPATKDPIATAIAAGKFNTLVKAVQTAGLVESLQGKGPFTIFAPTDQAFAALPAGTLDNLMKDQAALKNLLLYHVVPADLRAAQLKDGMTEKTLQGSTVKFTVSNGVVKVNDATVVTTDIVTSNGVIHVIDKVLLPPAQ